LGWLQAEDLQRGDRLWTDDGRSIDVDGVSRREGSFQVYNFEVDGFHSYFVSDLGVLVHNACKPVSEDVTNGPHGPERPIDTVISRALNDKKTQGKWLSKEAGESAVANLDPSKMEIGVAYSVPIGTNQGIVVIPTRSYPDFPKNTSAQDKVIIEPVDRALVILKKNGDIHTFPINSSNPAYYNQAPTD
jgi:Pretoxin HINT domain